MKVDHVRKGKDHDVVLEERKRPFRASTYRPANSRPGRRKRGRDSFLYKKERERKMRTLPAPRPSRHRIKGGRKKSE